jgi:hypothetical protein
MLIIIYSKCQCLLIKISLTNGGRVDIAGTGRGTVIINARNLDILGGSRIFAGIKSGAIAVNSTSQDVNKLMCS